MADMVERVAKAICESSGEAWESAGDGYREICTGFARAAIETMREPTDRMIEMSRTCLKRLPEEDRERLIFGTWREIHSIKMRARWNAMIDAAL